MLRLRSALRWRSAVWRSTQQTFRPTQQTYRRPAEGPTSFWEREKQGQFFYAALQGRIHGRSQKDVGPSAGREPPTLLVLTTAIRR
jgi:hypothetical protein